MRFDVTKITLGGALLSSAVVLALVGVRCAVAGFEPAEQAVAGLMPWGARLAGISEEAWGWAATLVLLFVGCVRVVRLLVRNVIVDSRSYLPIIVYAAVACGILFSEAAVVTALCALALAGALKYYVRGFRRLPSIELFFRGSLLLGAIPLLWAPGAVYALLIPVAVWLFRRSAREAVASVIGFALPFAAVSYAGWMCGGGFQEPARQWWAAVMSYEGLSFPQPGYAHTAAVGAAAAAALLNSLAAFVPGAAKMRTRQRQSYLLFWWLLALSAVPAFVFGFTAASMPMIAVPVSLTVNNFAGRRTAVLLSAVVAVLLAAVSAVNLAPLLR